MGHRTREDNPKVRATAAIWGISVGMLGASGSTMALWLAPDERRRENQRLTETVGRLEERVQNLETICSSLDLERPLLPVDRQNS